MQSPNIEPTNPLGLNLDFIFGRGYLWAQRERLSDWITLELLRMEIPDLSFPFDARGGLDRFRNTRCLVREIELSISEVGLGDLLRQAAGQLERFGDLEVRFLDDAVHIGVRVSAMGADTFVSFRAALIPPEPARADEIHLSLYDYRAYGPLPFPARLVAFELMTGLLNTEYLRPPGRGGSFTVGIAGDILSFRPLKLMLLHIFARVGWKLPNLSDIVLDGARIRPGALTIRAGTRDQAWLSAHDRQGRSPADFQLAQTREGARALGAYEAKDLFVHADQALFDGQLRQALMTLGGYRDIYGLHSELVSRTLDCLLADPTAAHLAEAQALCRELFAQNPRDLRALLARPSITLIANPTNQRQVIEDFEYLADTLRDQGDTPDWILAQLSLAGHLSRDNPHLAAAKLREILKISPRNRIALEKLRALYEESGDEAGLEEVLKRLTGIYTDRAALKATYLKLAELMMARQSRRHAAHTMPGTVQRAQNSDFRGNANLSSDEQFSGDELREARLYLEKVLRLDPAALDALDTLGESYVRSGEPLRALKAFGSAARAAEADGDAARAALLLLRVARLWHRELGDAEQALMSCRRALTLWNEAPGAEDPGGLKILLSGAHTTPGTMLSVPQTRVDLLEFSAELCADEGLLAEASDYWLEAIPLLETLHEQAIRIAHKPGSPEQIIAAGLTQRLITAHQQLAALYMQRSRPDQARAHHERIREIDPNAEIHRAPSSLDADQNAQSTASDDPLDVDPDFYDIDLDGLSPASPGTFSPKSVENIVPGTISDPISGKNTVPGTISDPISGQNTVPGTLPAPPEGPTDEQKQPSAGKSEHTTYPENTADAENTDSSENISDSQGSGDSAGDLDAFRRRYRELFLAKKAQVARSETPDAPADQDDIPPTPAKPEDLKKTAPLPAIDPEILAQASQDIAAAATDETSSSTPDSSPTESHTSSAKDESTEAAAVEKTLRQAISVARAKDAPAELAGSIAELIRTHLDAQGPVHLDHDELMQLSMEAGELYYYDLEEVDAARAHLERVRNEDPTGLGAQPTVLTTLEAIYEETGALNERIQVLKARLAQTDSVEMGITYRLLIAQLLWDEPVVWDEPVLWDEQERNDFGHEDINWDEPTKLSPNGGQPIDPSMSLEELDSSVKNAASAPDAATASRAEQARPWLDEILRMDAQNEAAHRLLAQIAQATLDYEGAVQHLKKALKVAGGGLDAIELERDLAQILLEQLKRPAEAQRHFERVLQAAPGDSIALDAIKSCQATGGDWPGYINSLGRELGLLIGKPAGLSLADIRALNPADISAALRPAASQIVADAAHIVEQYFTRELTQNSDPNEAAWELWGLAYALWPEHVEALEQRIHLDRRLDKSAALAQDLESLAELLLDSHARFDALDEAARLYADTLERPELARPLLAEAVALVQDDDDPPAGLDQARRMLRSLQIERDE